MAWFVYFLRNERDEVYVGYTGREPHARLVEHNRGLNRWTKARRPWTLAYFEERQSKSDAIARERYYKTGVGREKRDEILARPRS